MSDLPLPENPSAVVATSKPRLLDALGPGLITGASDDDPSGIATYSQAGAQFGYSLSWTMLLTYPLMAAVQMIPMARPYQALFCCGAISDLLPPPRLLTAAMPPSKPHSTYCNI